MSTFTEVSMVQGMPRREEIVGQSSTERLIASRVLNGWPATHMFLTCRDGSTITLVWFRDPVELKTVWSFVFETEGW